MELEIRHLKLVEAIAREGSVTSAASRLYLTQSALSHQLKDIEGRLGAALFQRSARRMLPTPAGERLLESAHRILDELRAAEDAIRQEASQREEVLRVATECYTCYHWLPDQLRRYREKHPRVDVRVVVDYSNHPVQGLLEGKLDVGIVSDSVRNNKIVRHPLFRDELFLIVAPDHRLAQRPYIRAEDLAEEHLMTYSANKAELTIYQEVLNPAGVSPRRLSGIQLTEAIFEMVKAGLGVGVMAGWAVAPHVRSGQLRAIRITRGGLRRHWSAALLRRTGQPRYITSFVQLLASAPLDTPAARGKRG